MAWGPVRPLTKVVASESVLSIVTALPGTKVMVHGGKGVLVGVAVAPFEVLVAVNVGVAVGVWVGVEV
jgi:hypothetical protein